MTAVDRAELKRDSRAPLPPEILADAIGRINTDEVFEVGERLIHGDNLIAMAVERLRAHAALLSEIDGLKSYAKDAANEALTYRRLLAIPRTHAPDSWRPDIEAAKTGADVLAFVPGLGMGQMVLFWMDGYWREKANCMGLKVEPTAWKPLSSDPPALRPQTAESGK